MLASIGRYRTAWCAPGRQVRRTGLTERRVFVGRSSFSEPPNGCVAGLPGLWEACCEDWLAGEHFSPLEL
jgi:hypothetical protein